MASGEPLPDISWLNFDAFENEADPVQRVLRNAYDYHCRLQDMHEWQTGTHLSLASTHFGNELQVRARVPETLIYDTITIGYFSPADGGFVIYPEMVTADEREDPAPAIDLILPSAYEKRAEEIDRFNRTDPFLQEHIKRPDYSPARIQLLHRSHASYLDGANLQELLDEYSFWKLHETPEDSLYADEATRAHVGFTSKLGRSRILLFARVQGAYALGEDDTKYRRTEVFVPIAERPHKHSMDFHIVNDSIQPYELPTYVELGQMVLDHAADYEGPGSFNVQQAAISRPPDRSSYMPFSASRA